MFKEYFYSGLGIPAFSRAVEHPIVLIVTTHAPLSHHLCGWQHRAHRHAKQAATGLASPVIPGCSALSDVACHLSDGQIEHLTRHKAAGSS